MYSFEQKESGDLLTTYKKILPSVPSTKANPVQTPLANFAEGTVRDNRKSFRSVGSIGGKE